MAHVTDPLRVWECDLPAFRCGKANDGGYVLFDAVQPDVFLSGGINGDNSFERHALDYYPDLFCSAYDPSGRDGEGHERYAFNARKVPDFASWVGYAKNALVKLDIEGDEWPWLEKAPLFRIAQLVVELHSPHLGRWSWPTLAKLAESHCLVHAHGNNWDGIVDVEGVRVPGTLETTWLRWDLVLDARPNTQPIPGPLDMPNVPGRADHVLDWAPFVGWEP